MGPDGRILRLMLNSELVEDSRTQDFAKQVEGGLDILVGEARRRVNGGFQVASGMVLIDSQLHFIAVRAIHPHTQDMLANTTITPANAHVAAFLRPLDDDLFQSLGSAFDLENLRYVAVTGSPDTPTHLLYGINGRYFGSLTWDIDLPSRHVFYGVLPALLAAIFCVGLLGWYILNSLRHGQMELWHALVRAQSADRTKTEFLANMSHELRTPLNAIIGFSEVMRNKTFGPLGDKRYVEYNINIHNSGVQLLDIIDDVLELSKVEAGKYALQETEIALWELTSSVCRLVEPRIAEKEIVFDVTVPPVLPALYADERALKQILLNLLSNAIKFTPDRGRVGLELVHDSDGALRLTVSDTGIGIPEDQISLVMEPFHQVSGPMTASEGRTGLGLSLTASLAALHGAAIRIESEVCQGTSVIVEFPPERVVFPSAA